MQSSLIVQQFIKISGRYDLLKQDRTTDNGALFYLNSGLRLLDLLQDNPQTKAWHYEGLVTGDSFVEVPLFRTVEDVWLVDSTTRIPLTRKPFKWIRDNYTTASSSSLQCIAVANLSNTEWVGAGLVTQPAAASRLEVVITDITSSLTAGSIVIVGKDENGNTQTETLTCTNGAGVYRSSILWTSITSFTTTGFTVLGGSGDETITVSYPSSSSTGTPLYYSPISISVGTGLIRTSSKGLQEQYDWAQLHLSSGKFQDSEQYRGIQIAPSLDKAYTLEGMFRFYTPDILNSTDTNFWTEFAQGAALIHAGLLMLESFHRNTEGVKDSLNTLKLMLDGLDNDLADEEAEGMTQRQSAWIY